MQRVTQNCFTKGELDPTLLARYDVDIYQKGARKIRNMVSLWTGAVRIAPGSLYIDVIMDRTASPPAPITDYTQVSGVIFEYNAEESIQYTIILRPDTTSGVAIDTYLNGSLTASIPATVYDVSDIPNIDFAVGQDRVLFLNENIQPQQLVNNGTSSSWTFSAFNFSVLPVFDYTVLGGTQYRVSGFTFTPSATTNTVRLIASSAIYTSNHLGGLFIGGGGIGRIVHVYDSTNVDIFLLEDFPNTDAIPGIYCSLNEVMWTNGGGTPTGPFRGWPARALYYTNRLVMGRSLLITNVMAFSVIGIYDNFDDSDSDATAGFSYALNYKGNDSIEDFSGDDAFIVFGATRMYATNALTENTINVNDFYAPPQGGDGSSYIPSVNIDNQIFHTSPDRRTIIKVYYDTYKAKINSLPGALLSTHLIDVINSMASWLPGNIAGKFLLASQEDGSMMILSTLEDEVVNAWSLRTTRGYFRQVMGLKGLCQTLVERQVNIGDSYELIPDYIYNTDANMDGYQEIDNILPQQIFLIDDSYLLIGHEVPFTGLYFTLNVNASADCMLTFQYLDANGNWNFFTPIDGTSGMTGNGAITWAFDDVTSWAPNDIFDSQNYVTQQFWIRIRTTNPSLATIPTLSALDMNLGTRIYLEQQDFDTYMDSQITVTADSDSNVTGATNLAGEQVYAIWNGTTYGPYFVDDTGATVVDDDLASQTFVLGFQYKPILVPMPIYVPDQQGTNIFKERDVQFMYIDYFETLYLTAAEFNVPVINYGQYTLDSNAEPQSGFFRINPMSGNWQPRQEFVISQSIPGPMTIRSIGYDVRI